MGGDGIVFSGAGERGMDLVIYKEFAGVGGIEMELDFCLGSEEDVGGRWEERTGAVVGEAGLEVPGVQRDLYWAE